jgi:hypothetical protein
MNDKEKLEEIASLTSEYSYKCVQRNALLMQIQKILEED